MTRHNIHRSLDFLGFLRKANYKFKNLKSHRDFFCGRKYDISTNMSLETFMESVQSELNFLAIIQLPLNFSFFRTQIIDKRLWMLFTVYRHVPSISRFFSRGCSHYEQLGTTLFNVHTCRANIFLQNERSTRLVRHIVQFLL